MSTCAALGAACTATLMKSSESSAANSRLFRLLSIIGRFRSFVVFGCSNCTSGVLYQKMRQLQLPREPELFVRTYKLVQYIILVYVYSGCVYAAMASADDAVLRIRNTEEAKTLLAELQHQEVSKHNIVARYYYAGTSWWSLIRTLAAR